MSPYRELLGGRAFRRLWIGSTASALGDGATWIALSWLVYERTQSPGRVGLLVFAYGAPVLVGGLLTGPPLDRFRSRPDDAARQPAPRRRDGLDPDRRLFREGAGAGPGSYGLREGIAFLRTSAPITLTTLMFASFNLGLGALLVVLPIYATTILGGGAALYAALTSALVAGDLVGSFVVGAIHWRRPLGRSIAAAQAAVGIAFLSMLVEPAAGATISLLFLSGLLTSPLTIWAQTLRMRLIPDELRGRVFSLVRTIMQAAEPVGGALGGAVIAGGGLVLALAGIAAAIGAPGLVGLSHSALAPAEEAAQDH